MQRATLTICRNCPRVVCGELKLAGVRAQKASRWDMWKPRFKKPIPTEDEKNLIERKQILKQPFFFVFENIMHTVLCW